MATTFIEYYLEGLLVGSIGTLALIVLGLFFYRRGARKKCQEQKGTAALEANIRQTSGKAKKESARYFLFIGLLFVLLYLWITPFMPYSGIVENKEYRVNGRNSKVITYFIYIHGKKRTIDKYIYEIVQPGDVVTHRMASQYYYVNTKPHIAGQFAWNTAFWGGVLGMVFVALCIGTHYYHHRFTTIPAAPDTASSITK